MEVISPQYSTIAIDVNIPVSLKQHVTTEYTSCITILIYSLRLTTALSSIVHFEFQISCNKPIKISLSLVKLCKI